MITRRITGESGRARTYNLS